MGKSNISEYLEHDHQRIAAFLDQYIATRRGDFEKATGYFRLFKEGLQRHMIWEEEILFPLYERKMGLPGGGGPMRIVRMEHKMLEMYLEEINDQIKLRNPHADEAVQKLAETLAEHNEREERMLYPAFDQSIDNDEMLHVIRSMENLPEGRTPRGPGSEPGTK